MKDHRPGERKQSENSDTNEQQSRRSSKQVQLGVQQNLQKEMEMVPQTSALDFPTPTSEVASDFDNIDTIAISDHEQRDESRNSKGDIDINTEDNNNDRIDLEEISTQHLFELLSQGDMALKEQYGIKQEIRKRLLKKTYKFPHCCKYFALGLVILWALLCAVITTLWCLWFELNVMTRNGYDDEIEYYQSTCNGDVSIIPLKINLNYNETQIEINEFLNTFKGYYYTPPSKSDSFNDNWDVTTRFLTSVFLAYILSVFFWNPLIIGIKALIKLRNYKNDRKQTNGELMFYNSAQYDNHGDNIYSNSNIMNENHYFNTNKNPLILHSRDNSIDNISNHDGFIQSSKKSHRFTKHLAIVDYKNQIAWIKNKDNLKNENNKTENKIEDKGASGNNIDGIARVTDTGEDASKRNDTNTFTVGLEKEKEKDREKEQEKHVSERQGGQNGQAGRSSVASVLLTTNLMNNISGENDHHVEDVDSDLDEDQTNQLFAAFNDHETDFATPNENTNNTKGEFVE